MECFYSLVNEISIEEDETLGKRKNGLLKFWIFIVTSLGLGGEFLLKKIRYLIQKHLKRQKIKKLTKINYFFKILFFSNRNGFKV